MSARLKKALGGVLVAVTLASAGLFLFLHRPTSYSSYDRNSEGDFKGNSFRISGPQPAIDLGKFVVKTHDLCLLVGSGGYRLKELSPEVVSEVERLPGLCRWVPVAIQRGDGDYIVEYAQRDQILDRPAHWRWETTVYYEADTGDIRSGAVPNRYCTGGFERQHAGKVFVFVKGKGGTILNTQEAAPLLQALLHGGYSQIAPACRVLGIGE